MSGVEAAGFVLAAIPLLISALEHYEDITNPTIAFWKYRGELSRATRELGNQHASFEQTIQILLTPITDEEELSDMIENTNSPYWSDQSIDHALRKKLGRAYQSYFRKTQDIQRIMIELAEILNIEGANRLTQNGLEAIIAAHPPAKQKGVLHMFEFKERVKFTIKRQRIRKSLDALKDAIGMLDTLYIKAEKLEEPCKATNKVKFAFPLQVIQNNAARLYNSLSRTWCSTHPSHSAGLLLEQRLVRRQRRGTVYERQKAPVADTCYSNCFGILLQTPLPRWLDVEFHLVEDSNLDPQSRSSVQFVVSGPSDSSNITPTEQPPYENPSQLQVVTNICSIIQQPQNPWIGFCIDTNGHLRGAYPVPARSIAYFQREVSLGDILGSQPGLLSQQDQYILSITLTASLLQLGHTPWLAQSWNKGNIVFLRAKDGSSHLVDAKHPYLTLQHTTENAALTGNNVRNDSSKLLALGVMLLEICSGKPIERLWKRGDIAPSGPIELANLSAARRWLMEREDDGLVSFAYRRAIRHCLKCFVDPVANLDNEDFARNVNEQVLMPLEEEMNFFLHGSSAC